MQSSAKHMEYVISSVCILHTATIKAVKCRKEITSSNFICCTKIVSLLPSVESEPGCYGSRLWQNWYFWAYW